MSENPLSKIIFGDVDVNDGVPLFTASTPGTLAMTAGGAAIIRKHDGELGLMLPTNKKAIREVFVTCVDAVLLYHQQCRKWGLDFLIFAPDVSHFFSQKSADEEIRDSLSQISGSPVSDGVIQIYKVNCAIIHCMDYMIHGVGLKREDLLHQVTMTREISNLFDNGKILWPTSMPALPGAIANEMENALLASYRRAGTSFLRREDEKVSFNWRPSIQALEKKMKETARTLNISDGPEVPCQCQSCKTDRAIEVLESTSLHVEMHIECVNALTKSIRDLIDFLEECHGVSETDDTDHYPETIR